MADVVQLIARCRALDDEVLKTVLEASQAEKLSIPWHQGDVMLIDNHACMHSRNPFTPPRRILASLGK